MGIAWTSDSDIVLHRPQFLGQPSSSVNRVTVLHGRDRWLRCGKRLQLKPRHRSGCHAWLHICWSTSPNSMVGKHTSTSKEQEQEEIVGGNSSSSSSSSQQQSASPARVARPKAHTSGFVRKSQILRIRRLFLSHQVQGIEMFRPFCPMASMYCTFIPTYIYHILPLKTTKCR